MSKERELLREIMGYVASGVVSITSNDLGDAAETLHEIQELLAQPEQEPVAWMLIDKETGARIPKAYKPEHGVNKDRWELYPLHTTLPKREPLSDEAICDILIKKEWKGFVELVRIIEKAHGIGGGE